MKTNLQAILLLFSSVVLSFSDTLLVSDTLQISSQREMGKKTELSSDVSYRKIAITSTLERNNLARILARIPGVRTRKNGGVGSFQTVSVRGTEGKRVAVYLNGISQMSSLGGAVDLSQFSGLNVTAVEIYRGFSPAKFGGNSLGGVINIITDSSFTGQELSFLKGSFGEVEGRASLSFAQDSSLLWGTATYHKATNDYPYWTRNGTPYNSSDDFTDTMQNNGYHSFRSSFSADKKCATGARINLKAQYDKTHRELPSYEGTTHNQTAFWSEEGFSLAGNWTKTSQKGTTLGETFSVNGSEGGVEWTALDKFRFNFGNPKEDEVAQMKSLSLKLQNCFSLTTFIGEKMLNENRLDFDWETVQPETNQEGYGIGDWESHLFRGKLSSDLRYYGSWGTCFSGFSIEGNYTKSNGGKLGHETLTIPAGSDTTFIWALQGGGQIPLFDDKLSLFGNIGRFSRTPSVKERFGFYGNVLPNPDLRGEEGLNSEIGLTFSKDKIRSEMVLFYNKHKELIVFIFDGVVGRSENISSSRVFGVEHSLFISPLSWLNLESNLTWQSSENLDERYKDSKRPDKCRLPDQPDFDITGTLQLGSFKGFTLSPVLNYSTVFYRDPSNGKPYPADTTKNGQFHLSSILTYEKKIVCLELQLLDILDNKKHKTNESGYYTFLYPGRSMQLTMKLKF